MVNNYPEYAAAISYQKAEEGEKHFYNAQVKVDPSDDSMSAVLTKDGTVISELPDGGGGGGDSDFSTAEVTVINNATNPFLLIIPNIFDNILASDKDSRDMDPDTPLIVPLYKGRIEIEYPAISFDQNEFSYVGSEGVSVNQFGMVVISGTGTLTITDSEK